MAVLASIEVIGVGSCAEAATSAADVEEEHDDGTGSILLSSERFSRFFVEVVVEDVVGDAVSNDELPRIDAPIVILDEQSAMQPTVII